MITTVLKKTGRTLCTINTNCIYTMALSRTPRTYAFAPRQLTVKQLHSTTPTQILNFDPSYTMRKESYGIEEKDSLRNKSKLKNAVFVDVRNREEIQESQCDRPFVEGKYLLDENCDAGKVEDDLPDKDAPHIVFCAKGGRASKACQKLKSLGYKHVYNAGGLDDLDWLE